MPTKKNATKSSTKAGINISFLSGKKPNKKQEKKIEKSIKKSSPKTIVLSLIFIIIGFAIGIGAYFLVSKNDTFEIVGPDEIVLTLDDAYEENGVKIIEFGRDISSDAKIETNMHLDENGKSNEVGTFYVKYTVDSIKYDKIFKIEKIKLVTFVEASEGGE